MSGGHDGVAVLAGRIEDDEGRESVDMPLQCEELRHRLRGHRPDLAADQVEHEVVPARRRAGADEFAPRAGDDQRPLGVSADRRILCGEHAGVRPVQVASTPSKSPVSAIRNRPEQASRCRAGSCRSVIQPAIRG